MKKYLYNFYLVLININKYGFIEILKVFFSEIYYLIRIKDFKVGFTMINLQILTRYKTK